VGLDRAAEREQSPSQAERRICCGCNSTEEGYKQIILTRTFDKGFPVDIFAKKDGVWFGFDVSKCCFKKPRPKKTRLFEWLGIKTAVLFLKPDKTLYFIKEFDSTVTYLSCFRELRAALS
jgi:hypothetical protein